MLAQALAPAGRTAPRRSACALVAILCMVPVFLWTAARVRYMFDGNWTGLFYTGIVFRVPPELDAGTVRVPGDGYDGQFYRLLAHDPSLRKGYFSYVDAPQLRFRRMLVPLAAWLMGLGQRNWIDGAYVGVEMIFLAMGAYWCARLYARRGLSPFWGLLFVAVPGVLASFDRMLTDGPLTALFAGFLLYSEEGRGQRVWMLAALAALTRESGLLIGAALAADQVLQRDWRRAVWFASTGVPAATWYVYVASLLPPDGATSILEFPAWGLLRRLAWFRPYPDPNLQILLRVTDFLAVLGLGISVFLAARWALRGRASAATVCVGLFAALGLVLGSRSHMIDSFGFGRPVSPLLLWVMLEAVSRKTWFALAPPLLVSISTGLAFLRSLAAVAAGVLGR